MTHRIVRWDDGSVIWEGDAPTLKDAVEAAIEAQRSLYRANLRGANLRGANLGGADLRHEDLGGANLRGADLRHANLGGADLGGANLRGADLRHANLRHANLGGADLGGADLGGADLGGADLGGANLRHVRDDIWAVLSAAPAEAEAVLAALRAGKVDGSLYEGECACLVGTIAKARQCSIDALGPLTPNSSRPAETFFLAIRPGDTPENSQPARLAAEWIEEWITRMRGTFGAEVAR